MSNPLAEILYALANPESEQSQAYRSGQFGGQQRPQYYRQQTPQQFAFYSPYDEEDEEDDYGYYPYRDYYSPFGPQFGGGSPFPFGGGYPLPQGFPSQQSRQSVQQSQGQNPRAARDSNANLSQQNQRQSVTDILSFLNNRGGPAARRQSDAGADLDAEIAAALRKELQAKEGEFVGRLDRHPSEVAILEALKGDIAKLEGKDQFESTQPDIKEESEQPDDIEDDDEEGTGTGTINFSAKSSSVQPPPSFFPGNHNGANQTPDTTPSGAKQSVSGPTDTKGSKPIINTPISNPLVRHHTNKVSKDPKPKIEVSNRNVKNPKLPYTPSVNIYDSKDEYNVVLAIPGVSLKDLNIDFHPTTNEIIIQGDVNNIVPFDDKDLKHSEIRSGSIERRVKFPTLPKIDDEKIKAKYLNGLLTVKIPKDNDETLKKPKRKVTIEDVPDEELEYEEKGGIVN
ncbi:Heat shock protein [Wickerhamomyces ciferrii]|uniref:Heat shock protein n=1 Tax=Wickerhamomyces ciferrii (strain ATCC 14091 / BCRC 22168 / CBS 111 / JCM 3599 / NBRC 0793 / NRRL Y-1031 F-60-10) TaxID=1206466 RepID=K0KIN1_WICCF|nr:Heat shock protein [Wickerhamomyces ciferrii]CCH45075.1 Heat shock protein [Wickerhamomyces ciferrii]